MEDTIFEIKRSIRFFLESRKDDSGNLIIKNVPIRMSVSFSGKRIMFYAGHRVDAKKWEEGKQRVKNNTTHANDVSHSQINERLDRLGSGINAFFRSCEVKRELPSLVDVKTEFARISNEKPKRVETFFTAFDDFMKTVGAENAWTHDTFKKFRTLKNRFTDFDKDLTFEKLNNDRFFDFVTFLKNKRGMRNSTMKKAWSNSRWFLRWAASKKYPVQQSALDFQPKLKGTDGSLKKVIFLTVEELKHLHGLEIPESKNYLARVRDVFVFCCFSGLRYSDVYNLKKSDDKGDHIEFVTQKTTDRLRVELNNYSREILDRYKEVPLPHGKALPVITNQKMNNYLKELGEMAGLNAPETITYFRGNERIEETKPKYELLSTHCARKTFVTNLIYMGVSDHVIRQWTGHKDAKSFDVYHKIVDDIKAREMAKFNDI